MSACNENRSDVVREISQMLLSLDPEAVKQTVTDFGGITTDDNHRCTENFELTRPFENFEQFATSYMISLATKNDCYLAFIECLVKADVELKACIEKSGKDADKVKRCIDQYAEALKKCIEEFEKCKKK